MRHATSFSKNITVLAAVKVSVAGMKPMMTLQVRNAMAALLLSVSITILSKCLGDVFA